MPVNNSLPQETVTTRTPPSQCITQLSRTNTPLPRIKRQRLASNAWVGCAVP
ncbi:hypothetical protein SAMN03159382_06005 [Pseudomonas sp. NFACC23-1]|nr:hypothetical protein SAMN03159386_06002 [Pseudomonas sp. NFACC17-2]SEJ99860.1 hypothetical protein SAMN03159382_06005 [Pseudomonas sp. NFACC23-1]SFW91595.1 hypothetical protein SAMN05660640_05195 [Pseudomonas sp. NFACC16-2]